MSWVRRYGFPYPYGLYESSSGEDETYKHPGPPSPPASPPTPPPPTPPPPTPPPTGGTGGPNSCDVEDPADLVAIQFNGLEATNDFFYDEANSAFQVIRYADVDPVSTTVPSIVFDDNWTGWERLGWQASTSPFADVITFPTAIDVYGFRMFCGNPGGAGQPVFDYIVTLFNDVQRSSISNTFGWTMFGGDNYRLYELYSPYNPDEPFHDDAAHAIGRHVRAIRFRSDHPTAAQGVFKLEILYLPSTCPDPSPAWLQATPNEVNCLNILPEAWNPDGSGNHQGPTVTRELFPRITGDTRQDISPLFLEGLSLFGDFGSTNPQAVPNLIFNGLLNENACWVGGVGGQTIIIKLVDPVLISELHFYWRSPENPFTGTLKFFGVRTDPSNPQFGQPLIQSEWDRIQWTNCTFATPTDGAHAVAKYSIVADPGFFLHGPVYWFAFQGTLEQEHFPLLQVMGRLA
jgi:hypothetical protein